MGLIITPDEIFGPDVVVSKLKRFAAGDINDIRAVVELGLINQKTLIGRFLSAKAKGDRIVGRVVGIVTSQRRQNLTSEAGKTLFVWK